MMPEDLLEMPLGDLRTLLVERQEELSDLRFQKALQQLEKPITIRTARKRIAQLKTLIREHELGRRPGGGN